MRLIGPTFHPKYATLLHISSPGHSDPARQCDADFTRLPLVRLVTYFHLVSQQTGEEKFMQDALIEAEKGSGKTSPNPAVGAVLVLRNRIIARGRHRLDGYLTRPPGETRWLTSELSRTHAHKLRALVDAIIVGAETIRRDNPRLTVRKGSRSTQPWRVILTKSGRLPRNATVFRDSEKERTLVYRNQSLRAVLRDLGRREITSVLFEGGGDVLSQALDQRLIDKVQIYIAPLFTGGGVLAFEGKGAGSTQQSLRLESPRYERIGQDICITSYPKKATDVTAK